MKIIVFLILLLSFKYGFSQNELKSYLVYFKHSSIVPKFHSLNGKSFYTGNDKNLNFFFKNHSLVSFYQALPEYPVESIQRVYVVKTYDEFFMSNFAKSFPNLIEKYDDTSNDIIELQYYPNDYGITNPNGIQGINIDRRDLDYINVQKAWDISTGQGVKIGISDGRIKPDDEDFIDKITFMPDYPFVNMAYDPNNMVSLHGTSVAAIAAAKGDNGYGSTGVCYDCEILATGYGNYSSLLALAEAGARVINMSWSSNRNYVNQVEQDAVNYLVDEMGVVLVASAGNRTSHQTTTDFLCPPNSTFNTSLNKFVPNYTGIQRGYPASYNGVISVSSIEHYYEVNDPLSYCCQSPTHQIGLNIKDSFAMNANIDDVNNPIGLIYNGYPRYCSYNGTNYLTSPNGVVSTNTYNEDVDVLSPANKVYNHAKYAEENQISYHEYGGTSSAAPYVSGTAALMIGAYNCINPREVDNILKLTAKDVVNMPINQNYKDYIGAGKLEAGDAVEFVNEMKKSDGIAIIKNHIFNRFNFNLNRINNNLQIENVTFKDDCVADFKAKNQIILLPGTHLSPNLNGYTHLQINQNIDVVCLPTKKSTSRFRQKSIITKEDDDNILLYPNPNDGIFEVLVKSIDLIRIMKINIIDINGRIIYSDVLKKEDIVNNTLSFNIQNYDVGVYFVKITSETFNKTFKIIKK